MRRSGWMLPIIAVIAWLATVAWPVAALALKLPGTSLTEVPAHPPLQLLITSVGWAVAVALGAMLLGWIPGRLLGRSLNRRGFAPLAALLLTPICLPAYMIFYAWWQSWPADTALFRVLVEGNHMVLARKATLLLGLLCWSWPLVTWCVAGPAAARPAQLDELLRLDGAGFLRRTFSHLRSDARGLLIGGLLVFLVTINNTTCFDLAEIFTFANELRAIQALNASAADVVVTGWPAIAVNGLGALAIWILLSGSGQPIPIRTGRIGTPSTVVTLGIWMLSVLVPVALFTRSVLGREGNGRVMGEFWSLYRFSVFNTIMYAAISGLVAAVVAIGLAAAWQDHRRWVRGVANVIGLTWLAFAAIPGTIIGSAIQAAYNRPGVDRMIDQQPIILVIGHLSCLGFVAALLGRWVATQESTVIRDLRRLDGAQTFMGLIGSCRPQLLAAGAATAAIVFVLALGEIPVTAMVNPPARAGHGPLALTLLNDMHYQRPQTVMIAALGLFGAALVVAGLVTAVWRGNLRLGRVAMAAMPLVALLAGCTPEEPDQVGPLDPEIVFGIAGQSHGQFNYPRAIDVDPRRQMIYVVDKTARVQRFGFDGTPQVQWHMPEMANGKPTGISVAPDGRVFVADTHYFRVIAYDGDGHKLMEFGGYGRGPGQFIYTTDVAFGPQGRLYVSEYGGNDRVQVFDDHGTYLFEFGGFGIEANQFNRPQSMVFNADKTELFIADACNHRIDVYAPEGRFLRSFGAAGRGPGELAYPYGLTMLDDGTLLVAEFGNNRIQHMDQQGKCLGLLGGIGRGRGELQYPWATAATADKVFVLDSGNNRVQIIRKP